MVCKGGIKMHIKISAEFRITRTNISSRHMSHCYRKDTTCDVERPKFLISLAKKLIDQILDPINNELPY